MRNFPLLLGLIALFPLLAAAELEVIVVKASRLGAGDRPPTVVTDDDIESRHVHHAGDVLRALPGMALSRAGNRGGQTQARLRGAEANHVLTVLDGIELNNPASGSEYDFAHLDLTGATRLEIANGPRSAVWGVDALAGLVYIDTTPTQDTLRLDLASGTHATRHASAQWARVGADGHAGLSLSRFDTGGSNIARSGDEQDGYRNTTLHVNAARHAGPWTFGAVLREVEADLEYDPTPFPAFVPADGDRGADSRRRYAKIEARHAGSERWQPTLTVTMARAHDVQFEDGMQTESTFGERVTTTLSNNFTLSARHHLNATLERDSQRFRQRGAVTPFGDPNQRQRAAARGAAAEYQFRGARTFASLSARFDAQDEFDDAVAWNAAIARALGPGRAFANVGTGVKNPSFTERYGHTPDTFHGNPDLEPEQSIEYEIGFATERLSVAAFAAELDNEIAGFVFDVARGGFTARNLERRSRRHGVEIGYRDTLGRVQVSASYTWLDATEDGVEEVRRPRHQGRIDATGSLTGALRFNLGAAVVGEQLDNDFSTLPSVRRALPGYTLVHAGLTWSLSPRARVYLQVENAFDEDYEDILGYRNPGVRAMAGVRFEP